MDLSLVLIGNRANFAAVLHVEQLKKEIWQRKVDLRRMAYELRELLNKKENLSLGQLIIRCYEEEFIRHRRIRVFGESLSAQSSFDRIKVFLGDQRIDVDIDSNGVAINMNINSIDINIMNDEIVKSRYRLDLQPSRD